MRPRSRPRLVPDRSILGAVLALLLTGTIVGCGGDDPPAFVGYTREPTPQVGDVTLPAVDAGGNESEFTFSAPTDELLLVYFGFTSCPDVCPTTLADVRSALEELGDGAARATLVMVSIDPEVDTPPVLAGYVESFVAGSVAVRTTDDGRLRDAATQFGADYGKIQPDGPDEEPEVYHTGSLYAVDERGQILLTWPFGTTPDDLASDLDRLLDEVT